ncbi:hypothetical protein M3689_05785 [Alkalihalophilus marmarensis]|nr:hypothetical protein [Alkalihalophilus marmarensis]MCM3488816.1 hypothetical protein [Alkalihalophilus marmarensis]
MDKSTNTQQLEVALLKLLKEYQKESGAPIAMISNWEQGEISIQVGGE